MGTGIAGQGDHFVLGQTEDADGVDLDGLKARSLGRIDAGQHLLQAVAPADLAEASGIERVETDIDAAQAGVVKAAPAGPAEVRSWSGRCL